MRPLLHAANPAAPAAPAATPPGSLWSEIRQFLPRGIELPQATWEARHRLILVAVAAHAILLPLFGHYRGWAPGFTLGEGAIVAALGLLATVPDFGQRARSCLAAAGLVMSSAILVQFSGGLIEAHFHYFIVVALIALYQDWVPFLLAILFVGANHGIVGTIEPQWVYNHEGGLHHPWRWALIHAVAILGEAVALLAFWAGAEQARVRGDLVLESAGDAVLGLDLRGHVTFANPAAARLLGRPADTTIGKDATRLLSGLDVTDAAPTPEVRAGELTTADGRQVHVEYSRTASLRQGMAIGSVVVLRDITARRQLERDLALHQDRLEELVAQRTAELTQANRELESFSYTVSHDLRSPLRSIDGFSRILLDRHGKDLPEDSRQLLARLGDGAVRMGRLIESVLLLSRISRSRLAEEDVDLSTLAHEILEDLAVKEPGRRVEWTVQPGLVVRGDPGLLRMAMGNLLANAWKFTARKDAARISFHAGVPAPGGPPVFTVEDNGAGFDPAHARDLFQPFHRMHRQDEFEGTGIGLATVSRILQRHGGRIWAQGSPDAGARFHFTVAPDPRRGKAPAPRTSAVADLAGAPASPAAIVLVEKGA